MLGIVIDGLRACPACDRPLFQPALELGRGQRWRERVPLDEVATVPLQPFLDLERLDAFRDDLEAELMAEADDRPNDRVVPVVRAELGEGTPWLRKILR